MADAYSTPQAGRLDTVNAPIVADCCGLAGDGENPAAAARRSFSAAAAGPLPWRTARAARCAVAVQRAQFDLANVATGSIDLFRN